MSDPLSPSLSNSASQNVNSSETQSDREFTSLLIELYRDHPVLWKVKSKDYFNRNKKRAAWGNIRTALRALKPDCTVDELKKKINSLRSNFNREYRSIEAKKVSGTSADDIPEPTLWFYNDLFFIKDQLEIAPTDTSEITETQLSVDAESASHQPLQSPKQPRKKKATQDPADKLLGLATEYFKRPVSEEDILAKAWAMKLKRMAPEQKRFAEKIITDVLFDAEMGTVTWDGVRFVTSQRPWSQPPHLFQPPTINTTWPQYASPPVSSNASSSSGLPSPVSQEGSQRQIGNYLADPTTMTAASFIQTYSSL